MKRGTTIFDTIPAILVGVVVVVCVVDAVAP